MTLPKGKCIVIADFDDIFVVAQLRKNVGPLSFVGVPTKHDGSSFRRIMSHDKGPQIYCAYLLMVQVGAKCPIRGVLANKKGPLTPEDLELKTGCVKRVFEEAIEVLSGEDFGLIYLEDHATAVKDLLPPSTEVVPRNVTERNETLRNDTSVRPEDGEDSESASVEPPTLSMHRTSSVEIPVLKRVDVSHLQNDRALWDLTQRIRQEKPRHLPGDERESFLAVLMCAECARAGEKPAGLFRWLVRHSEWGRAEAPARKAAEKRLAAFARDGPRDAPEAG